MGCALHELGAAQRLRAGVSCATRTPIMSMLVDADSEVAHPSLWPQHRTSYELQVTCNALRAALPAALTPDSMTGCIQWRNIQTIGHTALIQTLNSDSSPLHKAGSIGQLQEGVEHAGVGDHRVPDEREQPLL